MVAWENTPPIRIIKTERGIYDDDVCRTELWAMADGQISACKFNFVLLSKEKRQRAKNPIESLTVPRVNSLGEQGNLRVEFIHLSTGP